MAEVTESMNGPASEGIFGKFLPRYTDEFYLLFRLVFAFLVALHGAQKAFLFWGFPADHALGALVDIAGWVEFIAAFMIGLGIFTRLGAGALCVTMVVATSGCMPTTASGPTSSHRAATARTVAKLPSSGSSSPA